MSKMMRSLLPSRGVENHRKGRNSSPSIGTAAATAITSLPLGSTDGTGVKLHGVLSGIETQTQWQRTKDWAGVFQDVAPKSYSIRGSRVVTNAALNTNNLSLWTLEASTSLVQNQPDPDGGTLATKVCGTGVSGNHRVYAIVTPTTNGTNTISVVAKAGEARYLLIQTTGGTTVGYQTFDLVAGALGVTASNNFVSRITPVGDGWYLCECTLLTNAAFYSYFGATLSDTINPTALAPSEGLFIHGVMTSFGDSVSRARIFTAATPVTVCYDHLVDGAVLRPSYVFDQTMRYDIFRPTELARNMVFNLDECIEAVCSDGVRRYFKASLIVGTEIITNAADRDFSSDTGYWTKGAGWTIGGGFLTSAGAANYSSTSAANVGAGTEYLLTFDTPGSPTGALAVTIGDSGIYEAVDLSKLNHSYRTVSNGSRVAFYDYPRYYGNVDNVSLRTVSAATSGTTGATSPVFPPSGTVADGEILWEAVGYATLIGLELAPVGDGGHPEGVLARIDGVGNFLSQDMVVALDAFADISESTPAFQLGDISSLSFRESANIVSMRSASNAQVRTSTFATPIGAFDRIVGRYAATAMTLFNYGGTFTGAAGANITVPANAYLGWIAADSAQFSGCILNFCVLTSASLSDANAALRSDWDLKPSVGLLASGTFQTQV